MKLESQVVSLELAKKLKELGVKQESYFQWYREHEGWSYNLGRVSVFETADPNPYLSAFTVAELGEMLHGWFNEWAQGYNDSGCFYHFHYGNRGSGSMINGIGRIFSSDCDTGDTEANARAEFIIHLIEKGIVKP